MSALHDLGQSFVTCGREHRLSTSFLRLPRLSVNKYLAGKGRGLRSTAWPANRPTPQLDITKSVGDARGLELVPFNCTILHSKPCAVGGTTRGNNVKPLISQFQT